MSHETSLLENFPGDVMLNGLMIWGALIVVLVFVVDKRRGIGALTLAYFLDLSLNHIPGILAYLNPNYDPNYAGRTEDAFEATQVGLKITLIGMMAFIAGAIAARIVPHRTVNVQTYQRANDHEFSQIGLRVLITGLTFYFLILPVSAMIPSLTAAVSALGTLLIFGFWLQLYGATMADNGRQKLFIITMLPLLPLATVTTGGFIGFGTVWALSIASFCFVTSRRRIWFYLGAPPIIFLGLSLFVTYFQQREEIRGVVWNENTGLMQRLDKVSSLITDFKFLDLSDVDQLYALDQRLNQNYLVGAGVVRHQNGEAQLLFGATIPLWALVPRAIWPDKPAVGGGQSLVNEFTGIIFDESTSIGAGQVLEFYMNFGTPGVLTGFGLLGFILMRIDQKIMRALSMRNMRSMLGGVLPGLALLQPLGNLLEILVSISAAIIMSQFLARWKFLTFSAIKRPQAKMSGQTMRMIGQR